jgi:hypothetical protein
VHGTQVPFRHELLVGLHDQATRGAVGLATGTVTPTQGVDVALVASGLALGTGRPLRVPLASRRMAVCARRAWEGATTRRPSEDAPSKELPAEQAAPEQEARAAPRVC